MNNYKSNKARRENPPNRSMVAAQGARCSNYAIAITIAQLLCRLRRPASTSAPCSAQQCEAVTTLGPHFSPPPRIHHLRDPRDGVSNQRFSSETSPLTHLPPRPLPAPGGLGEVTPAFFCTIFSFFGCASADAAAAEGLCCTPDDTHQATAEKPIGSRRRVGGPRLTSVLGLTAAIRSLSLAVIFDAASRKACAPLLAFGTR